MAYSRTHTIDSGPSGDTVKSAIAVKLDGDLTNIFTYLNAHDVATTNIHGLGSGTVCGTTNTQTLENKTIVNPVISGATIISPTITGGTITQSTIDGITHTAQTTGFTIEGGTASKKLTLDADVRASVVAATFYGYKNLAIDYVSLSTATVTADEVFLQNSDGFIKRFTSLSETVDITKSGANGLDTGGEANSKWYHVFAIGKEDGTLDCLLSLSATAPTMPAGYTYKCYLGAIYNGSGGNFNEMYQRDNEVVCATVVVVSGGTSTTFASTSLAAAIAATAFGSSIHPG